MKEIKKGAIVGRKSYGKDVLFVVKNIISTKNGDIAILRGKREEDFAPVKNKEGVDSPRTAKELYEKYWNKQQ